MFDALREINKRYNTTIIIVTHDPEVAARVDRVVGIRDGRTSTEIRRERRREDGTVLEEEWVILDRTGRMQIPQVYVDALAMRGRVKIRLEPDHVSVWPGYLEGDDASLKVWRPDQTFDLGEATIELPPLGQRAMAVETQNVCRTFDVGVESIHAVREVSLSIPEGVLAVIKGRSGAGKTTLLNLIGGLDEPTEGAILVGGKDLTKLSNREKVNLRREEISYVFQTFGLIPVLSARENVEAPLRLKRVTGRERRERSEEVLRLVGLSQRAHHRAFELSGGEQQRVAVARALANRPKLILADEPTGQLDTVTGSNIIALLKEIVRQSGITVVIASHDPKVEEAADCLYELKDGRLISSEVRN
jgi:ABC-type lipoprotein export system ATPase subunit